MSAVRVVRIDQGHVRNAINGATAERLHDEFLAFEADDDGQGGRALRRRAGLLRRRQPHRPPGAATERAARPDPAPAVEAGDRRHRGLVRRRRPRAGGVVRPAGVRRGRAVRLPRAALGRPAGRRRHRTGCRASSASGGPSTSSSPAGSSTPPRPTTSASPTASCPTATPWRPPSRWPSRSPRSRGRASCTTGCRRLRGRSGMGLDDALDQRGPPRARGDLRPWLRRGRRAASRTRRRIAVEPEPRSSSASTAAAGPTCSPTRPRTAAGSRATSSPTAARTASTAGTWSCPSCLTTSCLSCRRSTRPRRRTCPAPPCASPSAIGVSSPLSTVSSVDRMRNSRMLSARDTWALASSTVFWTQALDLRVGGECAHQGGRTSRARPCRAPSPTPAARRGRGRRARR